MLIESKLNGKILTAKIINERLDAKSVDDFLKKMMEFVDDGNKTIILDISELEFIDSGGLGAIVYILKKVKDDGTMVICGATETTERMFKLTRMNKIFLMYANEKDALLALSEHPS